MRTLRVASLFAGCGGTDVGVAGGFTFCGKAYARLQTHLVYANDFEPSACDLFDRNFPVQIDRTDIRKVKECDVPHYDFLTAGFPCQSFSISAQNPPRLGIKDSEKGALFEEVCRFLKAHRPKGFLCENVKGILSANKGVAFPIIMRSLHDCGYSVMHMLLNAKSYGIPQRRERVFIVGFEDPQVMDLYRPPIPIDGEVVLKDVIFPEEMIESKYYFSERAIAGLRSAKPEMNKGRVQSLIAPCNTVSAHLCKMSLNSTDPVLCIGGRYRRFIPREVARIQSFPDTYELIGSEHAQYKALGNAIPPVLAWYVMKSICDAFIRRERLMVERESLRPDPTECRGVTVFN